MSDYYTTTELGKLIGYTKAGIWKLVKQGKIKAMEINGIHYIKKINGDKIVKEFKGKYHTFKRKKSKKNKFRA